MAKAKMRKHKVQEIIEFGEALIETEDLDPVYIALYKAELPLDQLKRLLLAYFCYYHLGVASWISEAEDKKQFWMRMLLAARNKIPPSQFELPGDRWPRASERRYFRGEKCVNAVQWLRLRAAPEKLIDELTTGNNLTLEEVMRRVQVWPLFGKWVGFKIADVAERLLGIDVEFPNDLTLFYAEPRAALDLLDIPAEEANAMLLKHFAKFPAPPSWDRPCGIAETETCLCKFKSYTNGRYQIGKDIHEVRKGLIGWGKTADRIRLCMPKEIERGLFS